MKTRINLTAILMLVGLFTFAAAGSKSEKFKVYGNCGMCENRIEKAAKSVEGVTEADWNKDTKMIEVTFDDQVTDKVAIEKAIAGVGHDTEEFRASTEVYDALPGCCKYDRPKTDMHSMNSDKPHEGCSGSKMNPNGSCCDKK